uniref:Uncharacterized protein n=1 Tax=Rhizophora mucronata TaxID=61149 RepID=A0A2P2QXK7_RHIMU
MANQDPFYTIYCKHLTSDTSAMLVIIYILKHRIIYSAINILKHGIIYSAIKLTDTISS